MAGNWWDDFSWEPPAYFDYQFEGDAFKEFVELDSRIAEDTWLQTVFHSAMFDMDISARDRDYIYQALVDHMENEYGIDFAAEFDWEGYREWYESQ